MADIIERLQKAADDFEGMRAYAANAEDGDCEPHYSDQEDMREASKAAIEAADEINRLRKELASVKRTLEFVQTWAWRSDPPNSNRKLTDEERLSAIKWHPAIRTHQRPETPPPETHEPVAWRWKWKQSSSGTWVLTDRRDVLFDTNKIVVPLFDHPAPETNPEATALAKASKAITYLLDRSRRDDKLYYQIGYGTEAFRLLTDAHAALNGEEPSVVEKRYGR